MILFSNNIVNKKAAFYTFPKHPILLYFYLTIYRFGI